MCFSFVTGTNLLLCGAGTRVPDQHQPYTVSGLHMHCTSTARWGTHGLMGVCTARWRHMGFLGWFRVASCRGDTRTLYRRWNCSVMRRCVPGTTNMAPPQGPDSRESCRDGSRTAAPQRPPKSMRFSTSRRKNLVHENQGQEKKHDVTRVSVLST